MLILLLCIFCNVLLAVLFKYFDHYKVDNLNAIIVNYIVCVLFASVLLGESALPIDILDRPWWPYSLLLGSLFIIGFNILALSFQKSGVALTVIIQKMSLVIPSFVAIFLYGEPLGIPKEWNYPSEFLDVERTTSVFHWEYLPVSLLSHTTCTSHTEWFESCRGCWRLVGSGPDHHR